MCVYVFVCVCVRARLLACVCVCVLYLTLERFSFFKPQALKGNEEREKKEARLYSLPVDSSSLDAV